MSDFRIGKLETTTRSGQRDVKGLAVEVVDDRFPGARHDAGNFDLCSSVFQIRVEIDNAGSSLRPGMFAGVRIEAHIGGTHDGGQHPHEPSGNGGILAVPRDAIINTGRRTIAFVEEKPGVYHLRTVELGILAGDHYVVLGGLTEGERVVERGSFLLDSQARLTGQAEEIYGGAIGKESDKGESPPAHIH